MSGVVGRFAPSPSGLLHAGSLVAALGSYLQARSQGGRWLVRMEDLDPPREQPGAAQGILQQLEDHGFDWDGQVLFQSSRLPAYEAALAQLAAGGSAYRCRCTRKEVLRLGQQTPAGTIYHGACRDLQLGPDIGRHAWRVKTDDQPIGFTDINGCQLHQRLRREVGDFIVRRGDGLFAYQLAVVVDDGWQGITEVVRGADLFDNTPRQLYLQHLLGYRQPQYLHLPLMKNAQGQKLSKQAHSPVLDSQQAVPNLLQAMRFLGLAVDNGMQQASCHELLQWATNHWSAEQCVLDCDSLS